MKSGLRLLWLSAALLMSGSALAVDVAGVTLETGSPDALCPELEIAREAVRRRLGSLVVEGRRGWRARYTIAHAPAGHPRDFVRLELFNPDGAVELVRDLPMEGESCRTMAEVIALVLDRHFRGLAASESQSHDDSVTPADAPAPPAPKPAALSAAVPVPAEARSQASSGTSAPGIRLALELTDELPEPRASIGLRGLFPIRGQVLLGGAVGFDLTSREASLSRGAFAETWHLNARGFVAWGFGQGPWFLYAGPGFATTLEHATTAGLAESHDRWRALNGLGLDVGFAAALSRRWFFGAVALADWRMPWISGRFMIDGEEALTPRPVVFRASLGVGYTFLAGP